MGGGVRTEIRNEDDEVMGTDGRVVRDDEGGGLPEETKKGASEVSDDEVGIRNEGGVVGEAKSRQGGVRDDDGVGKESSQSAVHNGWR